jgi:hypothetical protein
VNIIEETLKREIPNQKIRFVFPSGIAADLWACKACTLGLARSVAGNRFLAWDSFKEEVIREGTKDKTPASRIIRKLFAEALVKKNADAADKAGADTAGRPGRGPSGFPLLAVIPPEYARGGSVFTASIAQALPSLALWEKLKNSAGGSKKDDEDEDYEIIKSEYQTFLDNHNFFEPSWEKVDFKKQGYTYCIFFPEAIEDFSEYKSMLEKESSIHLIHTGDVLAGENLPGLLQQYTSCRGEIRSLLLELRRLYEDEKIPWEEMAVNVPELEELEPWLLREFSLYNIPFRLRSGRPLGNFGAGRLFTLISGCSDTLFSFGSLKSLLLSDQLPWSNPEINKKLIVFGIKNNCVSSYREGEKIINIWDEAFKSGSANAELRKYYRGIKTIITSMVQSKTFAEIRQHYFTLKRAFMSRENYPKENDAILARCIEELSGLIELEKAHPDLIPDKPFRFFLNLLNEVRYVPQQEGGGVNLFDYRVAAASPFRCQFILNASQKAAAILYQPIKFLRQDKRNSLGLSDHDASGDFFILYKAGIPDNQASCFWVSSSEDALSGYSIPHNFFTGRVIETTPPGKDAFPEEKFWWAAGGQKTFPARIFPIQKEGFEYWNDLVQTKE